MTVRPASPADAEALARLWHDGWHDAHAGLVPEHMTRVRTPENFRGRVADALDAMRVVGDPGAPLGFHVVHGDELHQLYVAGPARGRGVAAALIDDAEARLRASGVDAAWLACAIGNDRAARFYEKQGWTRTGVVTIDVPLPGETSPLDVWRYEKRLGGVGGA